MNKKAASMLTLFLLLAPMANMFPSAEATFATGGTVTTIGGYRIHTFTTSGTLTVTSAGNVEVLVVGGGGGTGGTGGQTYKGAGGAGGYLYDAAHAVTVQSYTVTIGAGGAANANGGWSKFSSLNATGGGHGGDCTIGGATPPNIAPTVGGSGGGGGHTSAQTCGSPGAAGTAGQGNAGGAGTVNGTAVALGGGGGGAGAAALGAGPIRGSAGGIGLSNSINGTAIFYAGGGGGGGEVNNAGGAGGNGGGGNGARFSGASAAANGRANSGGGAGGGGGAASGGSGIVIIKYLQTGPAPITDLHDTDIQADSVDLAWTAPGMNGGTCQGYRINYTTPWGDPNTILLNSTGSCGSTAYTVSPLTVATDYSFRVSAITQYGATTNGANILNVTTLAFNEANYTIGSFNFQANNPLIFPIRYERIDNGTSDTRVNVTFANTISLACDLRYTYAGTNHTYHSISSIPISTTENEASFRFTNSSNDITTFHCWNQNGNQSANYVLTQTDFLLKQQVRDFRNGTYGTMGQFGAFDLITLIIVIISMIGLNRNTEAVAGIFCIAAISILAYFDIVSWITAIVSAACVILLFMVAGTKKT